MKATIQKFWNAHIDTTLITILTNVKLLYLARIQIHCRVDGRHRPTAIQRILVGPNSDQNPDFQGTVSQEPYEVEV